MERRIISASISLIGSQNVVAKRAGHFFGKGKLYQPARGYETWYVMNFYKGLII